MDIKGKRLLILGGNLLSKEIVDKAKEMGLYTIVTDWYNVERSPVKLLADEYWDISITDYEELSKRIKAEHIDGIFTGFTDSYLLPYQTICEMNGLPCYGTKEQFEIFTHKDKYKAICRKYDVPTIDEYEERSVNIKFPVLVKPIDGSGSRGITICQNRLELQEALSRSTLGEHQTSVIIERYMEGREVTIFWLFVEGEAFLTAIGNRHVKNNQSGNIIPLPVGYTFPSVVIPKYRLEVEGNAKAMFKDLGIKNGMMFMQCKVENNMCYVYDIGYRLTGSLEYKIIKAAYGIDPLEMMIRYAITGKMLTDGSLHTIIPEKMKPCFNVSCLCSPGTISSFKGIEKVKSFSNVIDVVPAYRSGQTITEQMKGLLAQIAIRVLGVVDNKEELLPVMQSIHNTLGIISEEGNNLLLPGIESNDIDGYVL